MDDLVDLVTVLRDQDKGCPWDKVQTHSTIKKDLLEEVYEVMEAIDFDSPEMMREELGDVLGSEKYFGTKDALNMLKAEYGLWMYSTQNGGDTYLTMAETALNARDSIKKDTKGQESFTDTLKSVPKNFPALMRSQKLGKRAARAGVDFAAVTTGTTSAEQFQQYPHVAILEDIGQLASVVVR